MSIKAPKLPVSPEALQAVGLKIAAAVQTFPAKGLNDFEEKDISVQRTEHPRWSAGGAERLAAPAYRHAVEIQPSDRTQGRLGVIRICHSETYFEPKDGGRGGNRRMNGAHHIEVNGTQIFSGREEVIDGEDRWRFQAAEGLDFEVLQKLADFLQNAREEHERRGNAAERRGVLSVSQAGESVRALLNLKPAEPPEHRRSTAH